MQMQRVIENKRNFHFKSFFLQWEWLLVVLFIAINLINANLSPYYLHYDSLRDATMTFLDKAFIVLPMVFVMIMGDIDISVGSTIALSAVIMGDLYHMGVPMGLAVIICLANGTLCGFINGWLLVRFKELSSVIITLSTMIIYRGIAYMILENQSVGQFPEWFQLLGWGYFNGIPLILICFVIAAILFGLLLHKTTFGREVYSIGNNVTASRFSGVQVDKVKMIVFTLAGLMSSVTALFLTSRMGSTRPNVAMGYELDVIAMVVLGGVSTAGGKGRMIGAVIAVLIFGYLRYGLGLVNVPAQTQLVIIGLLLILAVMVPNLKFKRKL